MTFIHPDSAFPQMPLLDSEHNKDLYNSANKESWWLWDIHRAWQVLFDGAIDKVNMFIFDRRHKPSKVNGKHSGFVRFFNVRNQTARKASSHCSFIILHPYKSNPSHDVKKFSLGLGYMFCPRTLHKQHQTKLLGIKQSHIYYSSIQCYI